MSFPDNCIKGIPNSQYLVADGSVASHLFYFKREHTRNDGWIEQSINWEDNSSVARFTLDQRKENGEIQFKAGVAVVPRDEIDRIRRRPTITSNILSYERQHSTNNPYHGNILLQEDVPNLTMKKIAAGLALAVSNIIPQSQE